MATEIPLITAIPTDPPSTSDPANFDARADAFLGDFPAFGEQINATATGMNAAGGEIETAAAEVAAAAMVAADAAGLVGRSNSPLVVGAGTKNVTLLAAKPNLVVLNKRVALVQISDPSIKMFGTISSVTSSTVFTVTVVSSGAFGSGNYSSWQIIDAAFFGSAATALDIWAASGVAAITPEGLYAAMSSQPFTEPGAAGTFTFDGAAGWSFHTTIAGTGKTFGAPTNFKPGQSGRIRVAVQTGAGPLAFSTVWKFSFGAPVTASTNGLVFVISYYVHDASNIEAVHIPNMQA